MECEYGQVLDYELAACQLLRAIRGHRSQVAFARRLGYRGNPITDWEHGRRFPTAVEALRAAARVGLDIATAFARFEPSVSFRPDRLPEWLDTIRGTRRASALAGSMNRSRFAVGRWLKGEAMPRLPDFLRLVEATTGRVAELVAELGLIDQVPALLDRYRTALAARDVAVEEPWSEAILRVIEVRAKDRISAVQIALELGIETAVVRRALERLVLAGIVVKGRGYRVVGDLNVDTRSRPDAEQRLRAHWSRTFAERVDALRPGETFGYNVMSLSAHDLGEVREVLRRAYREIRSLVAASEPRDTVALVGLGLLELTASKDPTG